MIVHHTMYMIQLFFKRDTYYLKKNSSQKFHHLLIKFTNTTLVHLPVTISIKQFRMVLEIINDDNIFNSNANI